MLGDELRSLKTSSSRCIQPQFVGVPKWPTIVHKMPLSLASISQACGVSSRTLQAAFALHHPLSPMETLQQLRLQKLRDALRRGQGSVRQACDAVGLRFSGRTAQAYRRLFAELPSQTQRQAAGPGGASPMDAWRTHRENHG